MKKVYLSPSNQEHNAGKGSYGTEEEQMHRLARMVASRLRRHDILVRKSVESWDMPRVVADSNQWGADIHVCIHTNAGGGDGTVAFYGSAAGLKLTKAIYKYVAPLSPGSDEGIRQWGGLYEIAYSHAPCAYLELFFHDNSKEVAAYLRAVMAYADAIAHGICDYLGVEWHQDKPRPIPVTDKVLKVPVPVKKTSWWSKLTRYMKRDKTPAS